MMSAPRRDWGAKTEGGVSKGRAASPFLEGKRPETRCDPAHYSSFRRAMPEDIQNARPFVGRTPRWRVWLATIDHHRSKFQASHEGAAILEFAIVLPVAIALLAGAVELGRALYTYLAVEQAVRGGARYLARVPDPTCVPACSWGAARAVRLAHGQIVSNTGVAAELVKVAPLAEPPMDTVVMRADVEMAFSLFGAIGVPNSWTLTVSHQEQRIRE